MSQANSHSRRTFLGATTAAAALAATPWLANKALSATPPARLLAQDDDPSLKDRIYKTLKLNMVAVEGSLTEKFLAAKEAGFAAIEVDSPLRLIKGGSSVEAVNTAIKESGLPVDGTVIGSHWQITHSSPDASQRELALKDLTDSIRQTKAIGGSSVLLVVGHGKDGTEKEVWERSAANIHQAIPLCAELGIQIVIENVWNKFLYDHDGGNDQTAEKFVKYVDQFNSPWVGMQFDIGNHWKYGSMGDWIRQLGRRIFKLDLKGFSRAENTFTKIGEGDLDWADVRKALHEINYYGYAAAEVGDGDLNHLKEISAQMDEVFNLV